jgi:hypothetical protein
VSLSGLGQRLQPRRDIDRSAEEIAILDQHVAEMDADAELSTLSAMSAFSPPRPFRDLEALMPTFAEQYVF